ncbi:magnesium chelatase [bacterium (Candidatus Blackallbacteria) CG17_big_fil_post_rev_8_21_14_2_50_48_46]|uniref:Magnesium chelatase n=1 Tax=bacterium (Candidatus Blackallbacteria) CG17_big_fil_post_rev_8_21_14_2_50_48_46 TaxID=2014261 RepID=A0A2M7GB00_9BACT|nr:MAG: magnesium chelatase [bacterium (Candidatus Blackallbacteria) CG18_big_fil_WC_8_21_14_2_50_49_26]PIW19355.1 MAG: magnesium chelatase [bacterium (Candidatus Blackallbacteria) CG17_big_fil_post_rev_8_21_14_2_50_48_46]PIW49041.1 MAG: magnesium chelatase [bacterium (Candidatus Blackallbacteria) CG13_big_fil_rev_8_21_14_2_50_49_14]
MIASNTSPAQLLIDSISQSVIGKPDAVKLTVVAFIAGGHILLEDMPGMGKTLLAKSLAQSFKGNFKRVQFTSDMMPADITGSSVFNMKTHEFEFIPGPIFANIVLADEINRATPRSQSSLLEVMEERQVTVDGKTHLLGKPFFVIATQNPLESYGTFPLPESQLDRFMLSLSIGYPNFEQERTILQLHRENTQKTQETSLHKRLEAVLDIETAIEMQKQASQVEVSDEMEILILKIIQKTRETSLFSMGASTRAAVAFLRAAQALAYIEGRTYVIPDDLKLLAAHVLTHRVVTRQTQKRHEKELLLKELVNDCFRQK